LGFHCAGVYEYVAGSAYRRDPATRPGKTGGGSAYRGSVFAVACSWLALNVLQFAVGGLARRH
jgi:hypothetical protein